MENISNRKGFPVIHSYHPIDSGYEGTEHNDDGDASLALQEVCKIIDAKNPVYAKSIILKECYGFTVAEISRELGTTERNVRFYNDEAKRIGRQYNNS